MEASFAYENVPEAELAAALERLDRELAAGRAQLAERQAAQRTAIGELKGMRAVLSDMAWELEELEQRLGDLRAQPEGPHDPLADREITSLLTKRAILEERVLAQMMSIDELVASVATEDQQLTAAASEWADTERALLADRGSVAAALSHRAAAQ